MRPGDLVLIGNRWLGLYVGNSPEDPEIWYTRSRFFVRGEVWDVADEVYEFEVLVRKTDEAR